MSDDTPLRYFTPETKASLPATGSWPESHYWLDERSAYALEMALITGRPLLVKGEPGVGKSQLARAAAAQLECLFASEVVNINTEGQDLLWRFDPVARLNDAQVVSTASAGGVAETDYLHQRYYINPGILWWVFNWQDAQTQYDQCRHKLYRPEQNGEHDPSGGMVLLIDEIDKADPSLPNSLLEVLGNGGFQVPVLGQTVIKQSCGSDPVCQYPLLIITTNEERELPPAFLRRCLVLNLTLEDDELEAWLLQRAQVHFAAADFAADPEDAQHTIIRQVVALLKEDRREAARHGLAKPGLAEFLDLLSALKTMTPDGLAPAARYTFQHDLLNKIKPYALAKGN